MRKCLIVAALLGAAVVDSNADAVEAWQHSTLVHQVTVAVAAPLCPRVSGPLRLLRMEPDRLEPAGGEHQALTLTLATDNALGELETELSLQHCDGSPGKTRILHGFVQSLFDDERPQLEFGRLPAQVVASRSLAVSSRQWPELRLQAVLSADPGVDVELLDEGRGARVTLGAELPWGEVQGWIAFATNSGQQPRLHVEWRAMRIGEVLAEPQTLRLGAVRGEEPVQRSVQLRRPDGQALSARIDAVSGAGLAAAITSCAAPSDDCQAVQVVFDPLASQATTLATVHVGLPQFDKQLLIPVQAWTLRSAERSVRGRAMGADLEQAHGADTRLRSAMRRRVASNGDEQDEQRDGALLSWTVRNEDQVYGYLIYRAENEAGPFHRINDAIIRVDPQAQGRYQWRDGGEMDEQARYYKVEVISRQARKSPLTDVIRRAPR